MTKMISILKVLILQMIHTLTMPRLSSKVKHQKKPVVQCQLSRFRQLRWFWGCTTTLQVLVMENYRKKVYYYYNKVYMYLRKTTDRQIGLPFKKNFFISCLFYFSPRRGLWPPLQNDAMLEHMYLGKLVIQGSSIIGTSTIVIFKIPGKFNFQDFTDISSRGIPSVFLNWSSD